MAFTEKRLAGPTALTANTETNLYVCPTAQTTTTLIKQVLVTNTGSATTFDLSLVPQGGTAGTTNRLFSALALSANETVLLDVSQVMSSGDFISVRSGAGSTVNVTISGVENSGLMVISGLADSAVTTAKIADLNVATSKIDNLAVTTGKIANNAVTQEKLASSLSGMTVTTSSLLSTAIPSPFEGQMAFLTDTDLMFVWSGSAWVSPSFFSTALTGTPTAPTATVGTNTTQVATTAFANTAGGLVLVGTRTFSTGSGGYISYSDPFTSEYKNYRVVYNNIICSAGAATLKFGLYNGSAYGSSGLYATRTQVQYDTTTVSAVISATNAGEATLGTVGDATNGASGIIEFQTPWLSTKTGFQFSGIDTRFPGNGCIYGGGHENSSTSWKGFRLGGGITSGEISVYGYRQ
jgi:hypothetical protein